MSGIEEESLSPNEFAAEVMDAMKKFDEGEETTAADTAEAPADQEVAEGEADTGESRPPVEDETGRLHGEDGKFVEKPGEESQDDETEVEDGEESAEGEQDGELDDDFVIEVDDEETAQRVQGVLEKYDGDVSKALIALTEAQSLIGRKGDEVAQAEIEALRTELASIKQGQDAMMSRLSHPVVPITQDLIESDPASAAQQAVMQDNVQALEIAVRAWSEGTDYVDANPEAAQLFLEKLALQAEYESRTVETPAPNVQAELDAEVEKVLAKHPDLKDYLPAIEEVANENPLLKRAMETGTPSEQGQALEALTVIAKSQQGADTSREALKRVQIRVKHESDDAKSKARVVSASRGSAATTSQPTKVDQFLDAFDSRLGIEVEKS